MERRYVVRRRYIMNNNYEDKEMTDAVKNFLEVNYELLDSDQNEFFHWAYNGLSIQQQQELINVLAIAGIDVESGRETFMRFYIRMTMESIDRPVSLKVLINRYFEGILGFDEDWLFKYILDNQNEWDNKIELDHGIYYVYPWLAD